MRIIIRIIAGMIALTVGAAYAEWSGTVADQPITYQTIPEDSLDVKTASFCIGNNGELYVVSAQGEPYSPYRRELFFTKSIDGGYTWTGTSGNVIINADDGQNVYQSANKKYSDIAVDSEGRIFIVWCEDYETTGIREIMLLYSTDGGNTWENSAADVPISNSSGAAYDANNPSLAIDPSDNLHVVWHQKTDGVYNNYEVLYSKSSDHGLIWTGQSVDREISFRDALPAWDPDIEIDGAGNIYVVWNEDDYSGGEDQLLYGKSTDGGLSFSIETTDKHITLEYKETGKAAIHIDASNNIHVVYKGSISDAPYTKLCLYTGSRDGGVSWSGQAELTFIDFGPTGGIDTWNPDITSTSTCVLAAVYSAENSVTGYDDIWTSYSTDLGVSWSGNTNPDLVSLPDYVTGSYVPYIVTGPGDTLHVVWREGLTSLSREDMYYSRGDTLVLEAEVGWIAGVVSEAGYRDPIADVHVIAEGTGIDTYTNQDGQYILDNIPVGVYDISFSHDNYADSTVTNIAVTVGDTTILDVALNPSAYEYLPGDVNMALGIWPPSVIGGDVTYLVGYFIGGGQAACNLDGFWASADINGDCTIIGGDVTALVGYFVAGGTITPCPDYESAWLEGVPDDPPAGWPNCDTPVINSRIIPTGLGK